jgi:hypothetical protein
MTVLVLEHENAILRSILYVAFELFLNLFAVCG